MANAEHGLVVKTLDEAKGLLATAKRRGVSGTARRSQDLFITGYVVELKTTPREWLSILREWDNPAPEVPAEPVMPVRVPGIWYSWEVWGGWTVYPVTGQAYAGAPKLNTSSGCLKTQAEADELANRLNAKDPEAFKMLDSKSRRRWL
jgi:hypothetical protein